jgi:hypothetical protein
LIDGASNPVSGDGKCDVMRTEESDERIRELGGFKPERKLLVTIHVFEFGGSYGVSLEGDCHEVEVTPNLE